MSIKCLKCGDARYANYHTITFCLRRQLAQRDEAAERFERVCDGCGGVVSGKDDFPCPKCGEVKGKLLCVAFLEQRERIEELERVVGIAKTADGEMKCEGDKVWFPWKDKYSVSSVATGIVCIRASTEEGYRYVKRGYSTEALAMIAAAQEVGE